MTSNFDFFLCMYSVLETITDMNPSEHRWGLFFGLNTWKMNLNLVRTWHFVCFAGDVGPPGPPGPPGLTDYTTVDNDDGTKVVGKVKAYYKINVTLVFRVDIYLFELMLYSRGTANTSKLVNTSWYKVPRCYWKMSYTRWFEANYFIFRCVLNSENLNK